MTAGMNSEICRLKAYSCDGSRCKNILCRGGSDAGLNLLVIGTGGATDLDPPSDAAVSTALLPEVAFPCQAEDRVMVSLGENSRCNDPEVSLSVGAEVREEVLAVVWSVSVLHWRDSNHFGECLITCV